jgi:hypothetical protein
MAMEEFEIQDLLSTPVMSIRDVKCHGHCKQKSAEECSTSLHLVFPYRGLFMRHIGKRELVAEPNQMLFFKPDEPYRVSHPVAGGDACLSVAVSEEIFSELARGAEGVNRSKLRPLATAAASICAPKRCWPFCAMASEIKSSIS